MGLLGAIIIALVISSSLKPSLCLGRQRQAIASLLQNLLASNPQLLKMAASRQLCNQAPTVSYAPAYESSVPAQYVSTYVQSPQYAQQAPTVVQMPYPQAVKNCQSYPAQAVQVTETYQTPQVTQQVQTVSQTVAPAVPKCPVAAPAALVSPFLPAASPISALMPPTSSLLPPANPAQFRCNYLRKIPIPPPCM